MTARHDPQNQMRSDSSQDKVLHNEEASSAAALDLPAVDASCSDTFRHTLPAGLLHNLRTPLNQIIGYSEMLAEQAQDEGQDGFVSDLHKIRRAAGQMLALLDHNFQT